MLWIKIRRKDEGEYLVLIFLSIKHATA